MPFEAILKLADNDFKVLNYKYNFGTNADATYDGILNYHGTLNVTIASTDDTSVVELGTDSKDKRFDDSMEFKGDDNAKIQELEFKKAYLVIEVLDYIAKALAVFFDRRAFEIWYDRELMLQITQFMDDIKGPDKLIEKYGIDRLERNELTNEVYLDMNITPLVATRTFYISVADHKGEQKEW